MTPIVSINAPRTLGIEPSFGFGDRIGLATPGHVRALLKHGGDIRPIFAQQSIREMTRTGRSPERVMADALQAAAAGYNGPQGADADHLKTPQDIDRTAAAGFVFFTLDPSDHVDPHADDAPGDVLAEKFKAVADEVDWLDAYRGKSVRLPTGTTLQFDSLTLQRAAVKYGRAINHAVALSAHVARTCARLGREHEIELSVDETPQPTTLAEHYIIAGQCLSRGMKLVSLAPRFVGDFEKGVDYKGDVAAFERSLADHAAIARLLGPYKLSLHSGSDKLSIYGALARLTEGRFHVKTAGTSYLEALRVVARHDARLFTALIEFARAHYEADRATYHVSATLDGVPAPGDPTGTDLEAIYLGRWDQTPQGRGLSNPGRQILHCTFGSVLTHPDFGPTVREVLERHPETYAELLELHFGRHLDALR